MNYIKSVLIISNVMYKKLIYIQNITINFNKNYNFYGCNIQLVIKL
jgi:hypothetical protein